MLSARLETCKRNLLLKFTVVKKLESGKALPYLHLVNKCSGDTSLNQFQQIVPGTAYRMIDSAPWV